MTVEVTILDSFWRQLPALAIAMVTAAFFPVAVYANSQISNDLIFFQQPMPSYQNQPSMYQPVIQPDPGANNLRSDQVTIGPRSVGYTRLVEFMTPYIQPDLKMGITYKYNFTFNFSARTTDARPAQIPDGFYRMDMAVVLPSRGSSVFLQAMGVRDLPSPYDYFVTSQSMTVQVSGGFLNRNVTLSFPSLSATTVMNHLYIQFTPLQKECFKGRKKSSVPCIALDDNGQPDSTRSKTRAMSGYKPFMIDIAFVPYREAGSGAGNPDDAPRSPNPLVRQTLAEYIALAQFNIGAKLAPIPPPLTAAQFAAQNNLRQLTKEDPALQQAAAPWMKPGAISAALARLIQLPGIGTLRLDEHDSEWIATVCSLLVNRNDEYQSGRTRSGYFYIPNNLAAMMKKCVTRPEETFRLSRVTHILRFDANNLEPIFQQPLRFSLQSNFMVARSHSEDTSGGFSPTALLFKIADSFGIPLSALGLSYSVYESNGRSKSDSNSGSISNSLDFNVIGMNLPVLRSQRCLEIEALPGLSPFFNSSSNASNGFYICDEISDRPFLQPELYAHLWIHAGDTSTIDAYSPLTQSVNLSVRGDRDISTFSYLARKAMVASLGSDTRPPTWTANAASALSHSPSSQADLVINPFEFPQEDSPSFMNKMLGKYKETFIDEH